jgi:hypothetical protein
MKFIRVIFHLEIVSDVEVAVRWFQFDFGDHTPFAESVRVNRDAAFPLGFSG